MCQPAKGTAVCHSLIPSNTSNPEESLWISIHNSGNGTLPKTCAISVCSSSPHSRAPSQGSFCASCLSIGPTVVGRAVAEEVHLFLCSLVLLSPESSWALKGRKYPPRPGMTKAACVRGGGRGGAVMGRTLVASETRRRETHHTSRYRGIQRALFTPAPAS